MSNPGFIVIDVRYSPLAAEIHASVIETLKSRGLIKNDAEMKYYGLTSLTEDITIAEYWHKEETEDE